MSAAASRFSLGRYRLPLSAPGMRIGLFGGSFNPPHEGHLLVTLQVMRRLSLDAVWWLVSPGNPLKDNSGLAPIEARIAAAQKLIDHPRIFVSGYEAALGFHYSYRTISHLKAALPGRKLVWIMGADNLAGFDQWERWRDIANLVPLAVYVRPGSSRRALVSMAGQTLSRFRLSEADARLLPDLAPPRWVFLHGLMSGLSSSEIRASRRRIAESGLVTPGRRTHIGV